jgi:hypothetical protein
MLMNTGTESSARGSRTAFSSNMSSGNIRPIATAAIVTAMIVQSRRRAGRHPEFARGRSEFDFDFEFMVLGPIRK